VWQGADCPSSPKPSLQTWNGPPEQQNAQGGLSARPQGAKQESNLFKCKDSDEKMKH